MSKSRQPRLGGTGKIPIEIEFGLGELSLREFQNWDKYRLTLDQIAIGIGLSLRQLQAISSNPDLETPRHRRELWLLQRHILAVRGERSPVAH